MPHVPGAFSSNIIKISFLLEMLKWKDGPGAGGRTSPAFGSHKPCRPRNHTADRLTWISVFSLSAWCCSACSCAGDSGSPLMFVHCSKRGEGCTGGTGGGAHRDGKTTPTVATEMTPHPLDEQVPPCSIIKVRSTHMQEINKQLDLRQRRRRSPGPSRC